jgi:TolB-like protein
LKRLEAGLFLRGRMSENKKRILVIDDEDNIHLTSAAYKNKLEDFFQDYKIS